GRLLSARYCRQRVAQDLEVDIAAVTVPVGQPLTDVEVDLVLVVLAGTEPPEALRLGGDRTDHVLVGELVVALDDDLGDRDALALVDVERDPHCVAVDRLGPGAHPGAVVALVAVHRVDRKRRGSECGTIQWAASHQSNPVANIARRDPFGARDVPLDQQRTLGDHDGEDDLAGCITLLDAHRVEPRGRAQWPDRALHIAEGDLGAEHDACGCGDLVATEPGVPLDDDAVDPGEARHSVDVLCGDGGGEPGDQGEHDGRPTGGCGRPEAPIDWTVQVEVPVSARKIRRSFSGDTSTSISSPLCNSPARIRSLSGSSTQRWMARLSGRAP